MKKTMMLALVLAAILALALTGCDQNCQHEWTKADCENARTCALCGETQGDALGHSWKAGTCSSPKTCETCGATQDVALGHSWKDATCEDPKTCTTCGLTEGEVGEHTWVEATCMEPKLCTTCGLTEGGLGEHEIQEATCEVPQTCAHCGLTVGDPLGHDWMEADCENPKTCLTCGATEEIPGEAPSGHVWYAAGCEEPKHCENCGKTEGEALGHTWRDATCYTPKICERCLKTEGKALGHNWVAASTDAPKTCSVCGLTDGDAVDTDPRFQTEKCKVLFGTWRGEYTYTAEEMGVGDFEGSVTEVVYITFNNDGTAEVQVKIEDMENFINFMTSYMYAMYADMGYSKTEADQDFLASMGMTVREYAEVACEENNNLVTENVYYVANDELYMAESWNDEMIPAEIVVKGNKLTVYDPDLDETIEFVRV